MRRRAIREKSFVSAANRRKKEFTNHPFWTQMRRLRGAESGGVHAGNVELQTRSGNTENPDETWSAWSGSLTDQKGGQVSSPTAKFLQWRAILKN